MNLQEIMNQITNLGGQIRTAAANLAKVANDPTVSMEEVVRLQAELQDLQDRQGALQASYDTMMACHQGGLQTVGPKAEKKSVREMRASNEYAQAFCYALRNGLNRKSGRGHEQLNILFDALTETGGTTPGEDGGFLVPIDIDNRIRELMRELNPLAALVNTENVTTLSGWRVKEVVSNPTMALINEMATITPTEQPSFGRVQYTVQKYGDILPVSNELLNDEAANLMNYISRWFARRLVATQNGLILAKLQDLTASSLVPSTTGATAIDGVKSVLNKALDPAISRGASILVNQNGFDELDQIKDEMGRGLLQPDPVNATQYRMFGRPVHVMSLASMPDSGNTATDVYIGNFAEFATLFQREGLELASTDVGGNAWRTDSTEIRGICRMDVETFDENAVVRRSLSL